MPISHEIRNFRWDDIDQMRDLFNGVNSIKGTVKEFDSELMRQILEHPSCKPEENCYVAEIGSQLVGFTIVSPEVPISRAVAGGGVLEPHRHQGIGRALLRKAIERARGLGVTVFHVQAGADSTVACDLLVSEGFAQVKEYWQMQWRDAVLPAVDLPDGMRLRPFALDQDEEALTVVQNRAFGEHWGFCPNTVEEIAARVRMSNTSPEGIVLIAEGDKVAGYNWTIRNHNEHGSVGFVAMTGVDPDYRGNGLGTAVVVSGMEYLNEQNVEAIELEVDSANEPALALYHKLGFRQVARTAWYEKTLK
ncbi:MAG: GNAT family N-acetyltransferase [SAR202 cluster bacterium]|nr:GNAT family N-acetyltransferase [SAR202 cluster bacterium]